jgi:hypothetical protein
MLCRCGRTGALGGCFAAETVCRFCGFTTLLTTNVLSLCIRLSRLEFWGGSQTPLSWFLLFACTCGISLAIHELLVNPLYRLCNVWLPFLLMKNRLDTSKKKIILSIPCTACSRESSLTAAKFRPLCLWSTEHWKKAHSQSHPGLLNSFFICWDEEDLGKVRIIYHFLSGSVASPFYVCCHGWRLLNLHVGEYSGLFYTQCLPHSSPGGISVGTSSDLNCCKYKFLSRQLKFNWTNQSNKQTQIPLSARRLR